MKVLVCTLLFSFLFVAGSMAAEPEPAAPPGPATDAAFFCSLAVTPEVPVTKAPITAPVWQEKAVDYDCERLADDCLQAQCQCNEDCNGSVAQMPCVYYPRSWTSGCLCA
ncbi:MAG TPA: hypothetical protein VEL74_12655 [Thermoanaerobaculia bacterium]|nr:hypothetical protein [Thermoanaerobaculia bacterium]